MRLDKFLKVSRLIKRRTVANEACDAGRVMVNGTTAKASVKVKPGDIIEILFGTKTVKVLVLIRLDFEWGCRMRQPLAGLWIFSCSFFSRSVRNRRHAAFFQTSFKAVIFFLLPSYTLLVSTSDKNGGKDMDERMEKNQSKAHKILLSNRKTAAFTGILDVLSFDVAEILLETEQGMLLIKGNDLHVNRLTLEKGEVDVEGRIDSLSYSDAGGSKKTGESLLGRIFR